MMIHDDIFTWDGWGGKLRLASGKCRLRIYDIRQDQTGKTAVLRPVIVVVSDISKEALSVRSCAGHIATMVTKEFDIDPNRMVWIEFYPSSEYGIKNVHVIPERYEIVEFVWHDGRAIKPRWRPLRQPLLARIKNLIEES